MVEQAPGRSVGAGNGSIGVDRRLGLGSRLLTQLNPPLVKGIGIPDHTLHIDLVLIQRYQHARCFWIQTPE